MIKTLQPGWIGALMFSSAAMLSSVVLTDVCPEVFFTTAD